MWHLDRQIGFASMAAEAHFGLNEVALRFECFDLCFCFHVSVVFGLDAMIQRYVYGTRSARAINMLDAAMRRCLTIVIMPTTNTMTITALAVAK